MWSRTKWLQRFGGLWGELYRRAAGAGEFVALAWQKLLPLGGMPSVVLAVRRASISGIAVIVATSNETCDDGCTLREISHDEYARWFSWASQDLSRHLFVLEIDVEPMELISIHRTASDGLLMGFFYVAPDVSSGTAATRHTLDVAAGASTASGITT